MSRHRGSEIKKYIRAVISLLVIVPAGFYSKFYAGPAAGWVNNSLGGVFYEIFWCLVIFLFFSSVKPWKISAGVWVVTCCLEFLQMWHPSLLQILRSSFIGSTILGTTFVWSDFPYYFAGSTVGWIWLRALQAKQS